MRALIAAAAVMLAASPAWAGPVTLKASPADVDGRVTFGDVFEGAGSAAGVEIGRRVGPSIVFEAGQLQALARQSGLDWANPTGLRRVVVRAAVADAPVEAESAVAAAAAAPSPARLAPRPAANERVIARNDLVEVVYDVGGVRLSVTGRAQGAAAVGERVAIQNIQSRRVIDAVVVGPGQALAGPAAQTQFAAR